MNQKRGHSHLFLGRAVKRKCAEFQEHGYVTVTEADIWQYLREYRWEKRQKWTYSAQKSEIDLFTFNEYFDYQQVKAQTTSPQDFDWESLKDIL